MKKQYKTIGLVCQNEPLFQNLFNKILLNLKSYNITNYQTITFSNTNKNIYDYIIYIDSYNGFNINDLRYYIYKNNDLLIINDDIGDTNAFNSFDNIITFGYNNTCDYYITNLRINNNIILFDLNHNKQISPLYFFTNDESTIYYLISIIILLLNEKYDIESIKNVIQKIK